jgi:hypothetical protein
VAIISNASGGPAPRAQVGVQPSLFGRQPDPWALFSPTAPTRQDLSQAAATGEMGLASGGMAGRELGPPDRFGFGAYRSGTARNAASQVAIGRGPSRADADAMFNRAIAAGDFRMADKIRHSGFMTPEHGLGENVANWFNTPIGLFGQG